MVEFFTEYWIDILEYIGWILLGLGLAKAYGYHRKDQIETKKLLKEIVSYIKKDDP